ncbi:MAG: DNA polymerase II [Candidatus Eisenbacteria bacterium]|nr:DNA polymerase II [Candidatus Eisenbacteria bacterium]
MCPGSLGGWVRKPAHRNAGSGTPMLKGFILQPTYRVEQGRPVIHLFGRLASGETFVVRDDRPRPYFYIRTSDAAAAGELGLPELNPTDHVTMKGDPVSKVVLERPPDTPEIRDRLLRAGIPCYEADIPFAVRYLIDRDLRGSVGIEGPSQRGRLIQHIFQNPELTPAEVVPELSVLSLDIETDPELSRLLSVALYGNGVQEVHLVYATPPVGVLPEHVLAYPDEATLLQNLHRRLRQIDPDVLTGWNVIDFDLTVLERFFKKHNVPFTPGRADLPVRLRLDRSAWGASRAIVPGRVVLDGLALLRGAFVRTEDYRLDTVAREVLGTGKTVTLEDRGAEILRLYREDLKAFVEYNLNDARLVVEILDKLQLIPLSVQRSLLTGMPLDRVAASIAAFDFLYLSRLKQRKIVAPSVERDVPVRPTAGGYVLDSVPGIYENILVFDYRSLYPSLIRTFRLDPLNLIRDGDDAPPESGAITAPNGARFRREGGILPELLERFFPEREKARQRGDHLAATAIKIQMNSLYGVLATPRCRLYSSETANAITQFGQMILRRTRDRVEEEGLRVLYGDTDSIFVESGRSDPQAALRLGEDLARSLNEELRVFIEAGYGLESHLELRFERLYRKFFLPGLRHSQEGSKKRYAGIVEEEGVPRLVFTGLESVRRDWTELAKDFQKELLTLVFQEWPGISKQHVEVMIREFVGELRQGKRDHQLIYRKALRKDIKEYTKTTPPHVKAAQQLKGTAGRIIAYVMTTEGPQAVEVRKSLPDYDHYLEKQVRPIAEAVLPHLGMSWQRMWSPQDELPL